MEKFVEEHKLLACILIGMIVICGGGLALFLPVIFAFIFSGWWLLAYLPIGGIGLGFMLWVEDVI